MTGRGPGRLPGGLLNGGIPSSASSASGADENGYGGASDGSVMAEMLRKRLGLDANDSDQVLLYREEEEDGNESLLDYDPDDDDEDEIVFEEVDEETADQMGRDKFKPAEALIKTSATIVVQKKSLNSNNNNNSGDHASDRPTLSDLNDRKLLIHVPASRMKEPLSKRFEAQNQRTMKRDLTPESRLLNYLRFKGEAGFNKVFDGTAEAKKKLAERIKLMQETGLKPTIHDKFLEQQANDDFDYEGFWREQVATWIMKYEWRRREGPEVSKDELDREIEEWMSQRSRAFGTAEEMEQDMEQFFEQKGIHKQQLDADLDEYWKKKGMPVTDDDTDDTSTVTSVQSFGSRRVRDYNEQDLDNDLQDYLDRKGTTPSIPDQENSMDVDDAAPKAYSSLMIKKMTPAERLKRASINRSDVSVGNRTAADMDEDLEAYFARQKMLDDRAKQEEKEKAEADLQASAAAAVGEGDKFADQDFDELDDELEWQ